MKAREIFRRTRKTLKARLIPLAKGARTRAASAWKSLASVRKRLRPKAAALAKGVRKHAASARKSLASVRKRLKPRQTALAKVVREHAAAAWRALEPAWSRAGQWTTRSPWRSALVAAVVVVILLAALGGGARFGRVLLAPGRTAPLPADVRRAAQERAQRLAAALDARLDKKRRLAGMAGVSARALIALAERDPAYRGGLSAGVVEKFFRSVAGPECMCWRKLPDSRYPDDVGVTAWVLWALASYGIPAHGSEIEFLLAGQRRDGAWAEFSAARQDQFASTYATAAAVAALAAQLALPGRPQTERMRKSLERGAAWLRSAADPGKASWADYPAWPDAAERKRFRGLSGFALFALHRAGAADLAALDRDWIRDLSADAPAAGGEASDKPVRIGRRTYTDDTPYYGLPWAIVATVLAYPNGSLFGKVAATRWLEGQLSPGGALYDADGGDARAAAETLFALRSYPEIAGP